MKKIFAALLCAGLTAYAASASAQDYVNRPEWLSMKAELVKEGLDGAALDTMARIKRQDQVIVYMDAPIKAPSPWYVYWPRHIGGDRLQRGTAFMQNNKESFLRADKKLTVRRLMWSRQLSALKLCTGASRVIFALRMHWQRWRLIIRAAQSISLAN